MDKNDLNNLISKKTIEEKVLQLIQIGPHYFNDNYKDDNNPFLNNNIDINSKYNVGSILGIGSGAEMVKIQSEYLNHNKHKIPLIFMADVIHGCNTIFPIPLALSASFNPDLVKIVTSISSEEASQSGISVTFSPMVDLSRDPRWGRIMESFGECSYLAEEFTREFVKGYQKDNLLTKNSIASCLKHYLGYGAAMAGRDYNNVELSHNTLVSEYISPYISGISENTKMIMTSFNTLDNIPVIGNKWAMNYLRNEHNFDGVVITDYNAINELITYGIATSSLEASLISLKNGVDIDMASTSYLSLIDFAKNNSEIINYIDKSCMRVLKLKNELGLFENPYRFVKNEVNSERINSKNKEYLYNVQKECIILLKNSNVLPIKPFEKVAIIGEFAFSTKYNGSWSWHGNYLDNNSLIDSFKEENYQLEYSSPNYETSLIPLFINRVDKVIVTFGERSTDTGEAKSKASISLEAEQVKYIKKLHKYNVPIIGVFYGGRPLILSEIDNYLSGLFINFYLGNNSAKIIRDSIYGVINPSGKLPVSLMRSQGQYPYSYSQRLVGRPCDKFDNKQEYVSKYIDVINAPLYPFGFGLTYSNITIKNSSITNTFNNSFIIEGELENNSNYKGSEVVQVYLSILKGVVVPKGKQLIKFKKIEVNKQSTKKFKIKITSDSFYQVDENLNKRIYTTTANIYLGLSEEAKLLKEIKITEELI